MLNLPCLFSARDRHARQIQNQGPSWGEGSPAKGGCVETVFQASTVLAMGNEKNRKGTPTKGLFRRFAGPWLCHSRGAGIVPAHALQ